MFPDAVITRAHYARYMLEQGYVKNMSEAFDRYIGDGCPCFLPREKVTPVDAAAPRPFPAAAPGECSAWAAAMLSACPAARRSAY